MHIQWDTNFLNPYFFEPLKNFKQKLFPASQL